MCSIYNTYKETTVFVQVDVDVAHWYKNAAGLHHSHKHGFGLMDAWRLVNAAKVKSG